MIPLNKLFIRNIRRRAIRLLVGYGILCFFMTVPIALFGQQKSLSLPEAIKLGVENSKQLKLSQARVNEAVSRYKQAADGALPTASVSYQASRAFFLNDGFKLPGAADSTAFRLPKHADAQIGTASVQETIFAGGRLKYARQSTDLLTKVARLDVDKSKDEVIYAIVNLYYSLYKISQSQKVLAKNIQAINQQLKQSERFFEQGLVTKNDVLRLQLERANASIDSTELVTNQNIANYNFDVLLGLPEATVLQTSVPANNPQPQPLANYIDTAFTNRPELKSTDLQTQVAETNIKSIRGQMLPTLGAAGNLYYINPSGNFIPGRNEFLGPYMLGLSLSWNVSSLWSSKNKISEAKIQKDESVMSRNITADQIKNEVNQSYQRYTQAIEKTRLLETSVGQATENNKILESKYKSNIASIIDRIDANTQLFQSEINLEVAKADAGLAYFTLLKSTGKLNQF